MEFKDFKTAISERLAEMTKEKTLYVTDVSKDLMWERYLESFPEGTNPIFIERTEHDCNCCKQFIRDCGNVVAINKDLEFESIWDINIGGHYQAVADEMALLVKFAGIKDKYLHYQKRLGTDFNHREFEDGKIVKFEHFHFLLPFKFVNRDDLESTLSMYRANVHVFKRGLEEITKEALQIVLELIDQDSLYRGQEHRVAVQSFIKLKEKGYLNLATLGAVDRFCWKYATKPGARIRNTAIGTLLIDISEGMDLTQAVKRFESKVAPENYKRPTALITESMIKKAQKKIESLGYTNSLPRRNAVMDDLTINNVLFADRDTKT